MDWENEPTSKNGEWFISTPITNDEVKNILFEMRLGKAPGPDGFPASFYQTSLNIVEDTMCDFVRRAWDIPSEIGVVNKTSICLILKVSHRKLLHSFAPYLYVTLITK
jgi:hypothetical protein